MAIIEYDVNAKENNVFYLFHPSAEKLIELVKKQPIDLKTPALDFDKIKIYAETIKSQLSGGDGHMVYALGILDYDIYLMSTGWSHVGSVTTVSPFGKMGEVKSSLDLSEDFISRVPFMLSIVKNELVSAGFNANYTGWELLQFVKLAIFVLGSGWPSVSHERFYSNELNVIIKVLGRFRVDIAENNI